MPDPFILSHRVAGARYVPSPNQSGYLEPAAIMLHFTASHSSAVAWLTNPDANASAHVEIDGDGTIVQMVDFNRRAWHAGTADKGDMLYPNAAAIGIELVNPGFWRVDRTSPTGFRAPDRLPDGSYAAVPAHVVARYTVGPVTRNPVYGSTDIVWVDCLPAQLAAAKALVEVLCKTYPAIGRIMVHSDARSDKSDFLSPRFPIADFKALIPRGRPDVGPPQPPAPPSWAPGLLYAGMPKNERVRTLQLALIARGDLPDPKHDQADGVFGAGTERALKKAQAALGFTGDDIDGIAGPETLGRLGIAA